MGYLEDLFGSAAAQQQQQAGFHPFFNQMNQASMGQQQMHYNPMNYPPRSVKVEVIEWFQVPQRPRKHVESRVIENITGETE